MAKKYHPVPALWQIWRRVQNGALSEVAALDCDPETTEVVSVVLRSIRRDAIDESPGKRHLRILPGGSLKAVGHVRTVDIKTLKSRFEFVCEDLPS